MAATVTEVNGSTIITGEPYFELADTLDCGQAFRWSQNEDGSWSGIAGGRYLRLRKSGDSLILDNTPLSEYENFWKTYFDMDRDYGEVITGISSDPLLKRIAEAGKGIRILRQESWEALCSFIISQNNNIPRIKGIIARLCEGYGESCEGGFGFPSAESIAALSPEELAPLRCGFRARYIIDAAERTASGSYDTELLLNGDIDSARAELEKTLGVGPKVADCTLLFGYGRIDAFPRDVWIKRAMSTLFDGKLPEVALPYAGIVQQYLFQFARTGGLEL